MMTNYSNYSIDDLEPYLRDVLQMMAVPAADEADHNWIKWNRPDGGCVIFRAQPRGDFGSLDIYWREADGGINSLFCPKYYESLTRLVRDINILVEMRDVRPPRETLERLGRASE